MAKHKGCRGLGSHAEHGEKNCFTCASGQQQGIGRPADGAVASPDPATLVFAISVPTVAGTFISVSRISGALCTAIRQTQGMADRGATHER